MAVKFKKGDRVRNKAAKLFGESEGHTGTVVEVTEDQVQVDMDSGGLQTIRMDHHSVHHVFELLDPEEREARDDGTFEKACQFCGVEFLSLMPPEDREQGKKPKDLGLVYEIDSAAPGVSSMGVFTLCQLCTISSDDIFNLLRKANSETETKALIETIRQNHSKYATVKFADGTTFGDYR